MTTSDCTYFIKWHLLAVLFIFVLIRWQNVKAVAHDRRPTLSLADSSILLSGTSHKISPSETEAERTTEYWINKGQNILQNKLQQYNKNSVNDQRAKNIIMFLGDGMSVHTVTATRNFLKNSSAQVYLEKFPYLGLSKTYCVDAQVADSACTATAYLSGVKGNYGTIGVNAKVRRRHCKDGLNPENRVSGLAEWAQKAGMKTGVVSTARVTHASPAGIYAHTPERSWENDAAVAAAGCDPLENIDIARQLVEGKVGKRLNVILGGGRQNFRNTTVRDEEGYPGKREDGRDLIKDWLREHSKSSYVWSRKGLFDLEIGKTEYLLGLFSTSHCPYHGDRERQHLTKSDPSLSEMTNAAIRVLQQNNEKGFFLFIEGARIDMAHHEAKARKSLEDTAEMIRAVQVARELCSEEDTLIVVTSDHSHTMTINGYPYRSLDVTGLSQNLAKDKLPYTILSYANGPGFSSGYKTGQGRLKLSQSDTQKTDFHYLSTVPLDYETHGGDDVAVFASGPSAYLFNGNYEQSYIPALMAKASHIGPYADKKQRD